MQAINDAKRCCVLVSCTIADFSMVNASLITAIEVRRTHAGITKKIGEIPVGSQADLNFTFADYYTCAGETYCYACSPIVNGIVNIGASSDAVLCQFDDVFIGNLDEQYVCALDAEYTSTLNFNMNYVQTYYSAYPHAVSNGNQQYHTGSFNGVFMELDDNCNFNIATADAYRRRVKAFLANRKPKVIKTKEGELWCVGVNGAVQEIHSRFPGATALSFEWTEIAAPPAYGIVVMTND